VGDKVPGSYSAASGIAVQVPHRVRLASAMLWVSWAISACALVANSFLFQGRGAGIGSAIGAVTLCLQAVAIYFVGKGNNAARILFIVVLVLAIPGLLVVGRVIAARSLLSALATLTGFSLKAIALFLLFTGASRRYFSKDGAALSSTVMQHEDVI
jgi:hypothetical protein